MADKPLISFDYAIKYLLKSKSDFDIIEGFISAILATQGYKPVKINSLLESESNKEEEKMKKSIADLVVEDEDSNKYIVEIDRSYTTNFLKKSLFNTSRLVVDSISGNQDYTQIKKIFHISMIYFSVPKMEKPIYHGQTIIHEIDTKHPVDFRIANQGLVTFENHNIFPEYFIIIVPEYEDTINSEIDEWLYVMKNSEVYSEFKSPYMQKVKERLSVLKMTEAERNEYYHYLKKAVESQDVLNAATEKGREEGREQGREEGREQGREEGREQGREEGREQGREEGRELAVKGMLHLNADLDDIAKITGLSLDKVKAIAKKFKK